MRLTRIGALASLALTAGGFLGCAERSTLVFTDVTQRAGIGFRYTFGDSTYENILESSGSGVAVFDYDGDGDLDLYLLNGTYLDGISSADGRPFANTPDELYRNNGDGTFTDVSGELGLRGPETLSGFTKWSVGAAFWDYDGDGDVDLFQGNDHQENFLFRNEGDGTFSEVGRAAGVVVNDQGLPTGSMHGSIGDVDGDGLIDLFVTDLRHGALYRQLGSGVFLDVTRQTGAAGAFQGKGAWAAALFDFDNDGDLDVIVSHIDLVGTAVLLRNDGGNRNHWLGVTLVGQRGGPAAAIGALVTVEAGGRRQVLVNQWATSYLSHHDPRLHIGLGRNARVDRLEIRWASGQTEVYRDLAADRYVTFVEGGGGR